MDAASIDFPRRAWLTILIWPQETVRAILDSDPARYVYRLAILYGVLGVFWSPKYIQNLMSGFFGAFLGVTLDAKASVAATGIVAICLAATGALKGVIYLVVVTWLSTHIGRALGGKGQFTTVRTACAWSLVPVILGAIPSFGLHLLVTPENAEVMRNVVLCFNAIVLFWGAVICVRGLQEAHHYSSGRSFATLVLVGTIVTLLSSVIVGRVVKAISHGV